MKKVWQRYILLEFLKPFCLFLSGLYFIYILVDYSLHIQDFLRDPSLSWVEITKYYMFHFIKRIHLLLPLALLIGIVKVFAQLRTYHELSAFQSSGFRIRQLATPFLIVSLLFTGAVYLSYEFALPCSLNAIDQFYFDHLSHSGRRNQHRPVHALHLDDHSKIIYRYYDRDKGLLYNVIWIKNCDEFWQMKTLNIKDGVAQGKWIDHLQRDQSGKIQKRQSFQTLEFSHLVCNEQTLCKNLASSENCSISHLFKTLQTSPPLSDNQKRENFTQLIYKLCVPWLCVIAALAIPPFCSRYTRTFSPLLLFGGGVFGVIILIAYFDAAVILGETGTLSPLIGIALPTVLLLTIFGSRIIRT